MIFMRSFISWSESLGIPLWPITAELLEYLAEYLTSFLVELWSYFTNESFSALLVLEVPIASPPLFMSNLSLFLDC
jgi:hypothetical protein